MTLNSEVDRTKQASVNTTKVKENINTKLTEIGGETAGTLAEVPDKINKAVQTQYIKMVEIQVNKPIPNDNEDLLTIPISLNFTPTRVFCTCGNMSNVTCDSKYGYGNGPDESIEVVSFDRNHVTIHGYSSVGFTVNCKRLIIIGN